MKKLLLIALVGTVASTGLAIWFAIPLIKQNKNRIAIFLSKLEN